MVTQITDVLPDIKDALNGTVYNYPDNYRWPRPVVERHAKFAVKEHLGLDKFASLPAVDYNVNYGPYGVVQIRQGRVVTKPVT